jgi:hypothetical protein
MTHTTPFRMIALLLAVVLLAVAATPGRAEAVDALTIVAIAGLAVAGIILIAYLIVANVEGDRSARATQTVWVACAGDDCVSIPARTAAALAAAPVERQAP